MWLDTGDGNIAQAMFFCNASALFTQRFSVDVCVACSASALLFIWRCSAVGWFAALQRCCLYGAAAPLVVRVRVRARWCWSLDLNDASASLLMVVLVWHFILHVFTTADAITNASEMGGSM